MEIKRFSNAISNPSTFEQRNKKHFLDRRLKREKIPNISCFLVVFPFKSRVRNQTVGSRGSLNNLDVSPYIRIRSVIRVGGERVTYVCTTGSVFSVCVSACLCGRLQDVVHV